MANPYSVYKNVSINTLSKEQLLLALLDGSVTYIKRARQAIIDKNYSDAHDNLMKVQNIYIELMSTLNVESIKNGKELLELYNFVNNTVVEVNMKKDINLIDQTIPIIIEIRDMWYEAYHMSTNKNNRK